MAHSKATEFPLVHFYSLTPTHGCACFVPEPGQNIHLPLPKKKQAGFEMVGLSWSMFRSGLR
jgi:hypothetical protein